jgi:PRA1 family protein
MLSVRAGVAMTESLSPEKHGVPDSSSASQPGEKSIETAGVGTAVPLEFDTGAQRNEEMQQLVPGSEAQAGISGAIASIRAKTTRLLETQKPWSEMVDRNSFSKPETLGEATNRIQKNLNHYRTNYLLFGLTITALAFLTNPLSLIYCAVLAMMWAYLFLVRTSPLVINGREISDREKMIGMTVTSFVVIFFLTNVAAIFLYGASQTSCSLMRGMAQTTTFSGM